jgi:hypothetical protein
MEFHARRQFRVIGSKKVKGKLYLYLLQKKETTAISILQTTVIWMMQIKFISQRKHHLLLGFCCDF